MGLILQQPQPQYRCAKVVIKTWIEWYNENPIIQADIIGLAIDKGRFFVGNGTTAFKDSYFFMYADQVV